MAEPKGVNQTAKCFKDKEVLLDLDIEKDFLASWKSITVGETNKFDFDLTPVSNGKKKSINFDQADMDFNLDGDFGINIDIPDLDISPPSKKDEVTNEKTKESSHRSDERESGCFDFGFDFDELGNFDLGSTVKTSDSNSKCQKDKKGFTYESSPEVKKDSVQHNPVTDNSSDGDGARKPFRLRSVMSFDMVSLVGRNEKHEQEEKCLVCPSEGICSDIASLDVSAGNAEVQLAPDKSKITAESTMASTELPRRNRTENLPSKELHVLDQEAFVVKTCMQDFTSSSLSGSSQGGGNPCDTKEKVEFVTKSDVASGGEVVLKLQPTSGQSSTLKSPQDFNVIKKSEQNEENRFEDRVTAKGGKPVHIECSTSYEKSSDIRAATGIPYHALSRMENQELASHFFTRSQQTDASEINKGTEASITGKTTGFQSDNKGDSMAFSAQEAFSSLCTKKAGITQPTLAEGRRGSDGVQIQRKLSSVYLHSSLQRNELTEPQTGLRDLKIIGNMTFVGGSSNVKKTNDLPFKEDEILEKRKANSQQRKMSMKDVGILSVEFSKNALQNAGNVAHPSLCPTTKNIPVEGKRFSPVASHKKILNLCGLGLSGLNVDPAKSSNQKVLESAGQFSRIWLYASHVPGSQKETSSDLSRKRKTVEGGANSAHLAKRCFQSSPANRGSEEEREKYMNEKEASYHSSPEEDCIKFKIDDSHESLNIQHDDKVIVLEMAYAIEDNGNVIQAEAYGKELDHLCSILRKKHDEAKDTLVQAIVTGNKLLLLNSPIFEQKISAARELLDRLSLSNNDF